VSPNTEAHSSLIRGTYLFLTSPPVLLLIKAVVQLGVFLCSSIHQVKSIDDTLQSNLVLPAQPVLKILVSLILVSFVLVVPNLGIDAPLIGFIIILDAAIRFTIAFCVGHLAD
jgi:hypothetical protein